MTSSRWSPLREAQERARAAGHHTFTIPLACPRGHQGARYASNGNCVQCASHSKRTTKPAAERTLRLEPGKGHVTQITLDEETATDIANAKRHLSEVIGRPVSKSLIHRAAIRALARYLRNPNNAAEAKSLIY